MIINQVSVFLENKPGQLLEFTNLMAENNINILALALSEAPDYGLLRVIVDEYEAVEAIAKEKGYLCTVTPVVAVDVPNEPGSLVKILDILAKNNINVAYSYISFIDKNGSDGIILRVDDTEGAEKLLKEAGIVA